MEKRRPGRPISDKKPPRSILWAAHYIQSLYGLPQGFSERATRYCSHVMGVSEDQKRNLLLNEAELLSTILTVGALTRPNARQSEIPALMKALSSLNEFRGWRAPLSDDTPDVETHRKHGVFIGTLARMIRDEVPEELDHWGIQIHGREIIGFLGFHDNPTIHFQSRPQVQRCRACIEVCMSCDVLNDIAWAYRQTQSSKAA
jgi:hypothetical protein